MGNGKFEWKQAVFQRYPDPKQGWGRGFLVLLSVVRDDENRILAKALSDRASILNWAWNPAGARIII